MDTYTDSAGDECCDNCNEPIGDCVCCCVDCDEPVSECSCEEGPAYPAVTA